MSDVILRIAFVAFIVWSIASGFSDGGVWQAMGAGVLLGLLLSDASDWEIKRRFASKYGYRQKWVPIEDEER